jgi:putative transposase
MRLIDEEYTRHPFYGVKRMTGWLAGQGYAVNEKRVRRLLRLMGIMAIYPKPRLSAGSPRQAVYPYLLRGLLITRPDQVWGTDITYIRMRKGFIYLVAIMDLFTRYVVSWEVSTTLETEFCLGALDRALRISTPEIFNSDQGVQFTRDDFTGRLQSAGIRISWDGKGRAFDNIFVERLWRSVKYEEVYLKDYSTVREAIRGLNAYFRFYNTERLHQSLENNTPWNVYRGMPQAVPLRYAQENTVAWAG